MLGNLTLTPRFVVHFVRIGKQQLTLKSEYTRVNAKKDKYDVLPFFFGNWSYLRTVGEDPTESKSRPVINKIG